MNKLTASILVLLMMATPLSVLATSVHSQPLHHSPQWGGGTGTIEDPFIVTNVWELQNITLDVFKHYALGNDIDASITSTWNAGAGFAPIGVFYRSLDGRGHTISNLFINRGGTPEVALFQRLTVADAKVFDLTMTGAQMWGSNNIGLIAGINVGIIENCAVSGTMTSGSNQVGGIVGVNQATGIIKNCHASVTVSGSFWSVGGLAGNNYGTITNSYATGSVNGNQFVGGLVGQNTGTISRCYATGNVNVNAISYQTGGLVGDNNGGSISNCYATGAVDGWKQLGGLVGTNRNSGSVSYSYSIGAVTADAVPYGGLVGENTATVTTSYWNIWTSGRAASAGGIGETTTTMKLQSTFVGWNFLGTWWIIPTVTYPQLLMLEVKAPIRINSNADFDTAHGVVNEATGDGSPGNPWIIENYDINGAGAGYCIYVGNTTEHFAVRDCYLYNATGGDSSNYFPNAGLALYNVVNGSAIGNVLADNGNYGVRMEEGSDVTIANNTFIRTGNGAWIKWADNVTLHENDFIECWDGIYYWGSHWGNITGNYLEDCQIHLLHSANSNVSSNELLNAGITLDSNVLGNWNTHTMLGNTVNGKPVIYWKDTAGGKVPEGAGQVILANCTGVAVENQNMSACRVGISLGFSDGNILANNTVSGNEWAGIFLYQSLSNTVTNNTVSYNDRGIRLDYSAGNMVLNNTATNNGQGGLYLYNSANNDMMNNQVNNNDYGISIDFFSVSNTVTSNNLSMNDYGIVISFGSHNNEFARNTVSGSLTSSVQIDGGINGNLFYHNAFIGNPIQAFDGGSTYWDNGYPGGGNYWSDYTGTDLFNGPAQDLPGGDGLGDTPYLIDGGAQDNYPLLQPWFHDTVPPVADAGPDQDVDEDTVMQFNGTGSSDNVGIVNYTWAFTDGGPVAIYGSVPTYMFNTPGNYTVTLTVRDSAGNSDSDTMIVNVRDATPPQSDPIVPASADEGQNVLFDGSLSSDNVGIVNYTWTFDDNGPVTLYGMFVNYTFSTPGIHIITLTVWDAAGHWGGGGVPITINDIHDPVADAGPDQTVDEDSPMQFDGTGSSDSSGIANYTWTFTDGGSRILYDPAPAYTFFTPGFYNVTLMVRDSANRTGMDMVLIIVRDITPPVANAGPDDLILVGNNYQLNNGGAASTDNVGIVNYTWNFTYNGSEVYLYESFPYFFFGIHGVYVITLTVRDAAGNTGSDTMNLTVRETTPPVANAGPDQAVNEDTIVTFDGSGSSDNVGVVNWTWHCLFQTETQNGFTLYGVTAHYTFETPGRYTVTLRVTDAAGNYAEDTMEVVVRDITPPQVDAGPDASFSQYQLYTFYASNCSDNVGITDYEWTFTHNGVQHILYGQSASFVFEIPGTYVVTLTAEDATGNRANDTMLLTIIDGEKPQANAGGYHSVTAGALVTFNGTASTDNVAIVNYTWSFFYGDSAVHLYGAVATFRFEIPGNYTVTLTIMDAAWNTDTATTIVMVTETDDGGDGPVDTFPVVIGPVLDPAGNPLSGALVTLTINGTEYTGSTDADGNAMISVPRDVVGQEAAVSISKDGYDTTSYTTALGQDGTSATQPPEMEPSTLGPDDQRYDYTWMYIILILVIVGVIGGAMLVKGKGKAPAGVPEEAVPEEAGAMPEEAEPEGEPAPEEGAVDELPPPPRD